MCERSLGLSLDSRLTSRRLVKKRLDLSIPPQIPGSEARRLELPKEPTAKQREIERLFPELPPLPAAPIPQPGPNGQPYTLADLQQFATANSPQLRQAASDVEAARGNLLQANAYPNPTVNYQMQPSNNGSTPGFDGFGVDQTIKTGGKLGLQRAAAEMDLHNAELALCRARSDLATQVGNVLFRRSSGQGNGPGERGFGPLHGGSLSAPSPNVGTFLFSTRCSKPIPAVDSGTLPVSYPEVRMLSVDSGLAALVRPQSAYAEDASLFSLQHFLHCIDLKCLVCNNPLEPAVFALDLLHPFQIRELKSAVFALPTEVRVL